MFQHITRSPLAAPVVAAALCLMMAPAVHAQSAFADFTTIDANTQTATGTLSGVSFTLVSTFANPRPNVGPGGIAGGTTNGTFTGFNQASFTPPLASGDAVGLGGASDFRLTFAAPVSNLTLHIYQLQSNTLSFTAGGTSASFSLLSSDGDFNIPVGGTSTSITGSAGNGNDANGSLFFSGTFSELSWTATRPVTGSAADDGYNLQLSVSSIVPESGTLAFVLPGLALMGVVLLPRRKMA